MHPFQWGGEGEFLDGLYSQEEDTELGRKVWELARERRGAKNGTGARPSGLLAGPGFLSWV